MNYKDKVYSIVEGYINKAAELTAWEKDLAEFWRRNELSDFEEYLDTRRAGIYCDARPEI